MDSRSGYVISLWTIGGTVIGALIALILLPFAKHGNWIDLFAILTAAGYGAGWVGGFLKLGGES